MKKTLFLLTLVAFSGCNYKVDKTNTADDGIGGLSAGPLSYQAVSSGVLAKNCVSCHSDAGGNKGGVNLESYAEVKRHSVKIRDEVVARTMPPRNKLSDAQINLIVTWIDAGASEDGQSQTTPTPPVNPPGQQPPPPTQPPVVAPPADPVFTLPEDPKQISYEMVRVNLFVPKCLKCHSEPENKGDVNLETYANVIANLDDIDSDIADGSMPRGKNNKLTEDQKQLFFRWKNNGAPEKAEAPAPPVVTPTPAPVPSSAPADPVFTIPADAKDITFDMVYKNVIVPKCLKCHSAPNDKGDVNLETYTTVIENLAASYDEIKDGTMPRGKGNVMTNDQKELFFRWHDAGAKENGANGSK